MYDSLLNETNKKVDFLSFHVLCHAYPESHLKEKLRSKIGIFFSFFIFALEHKVGIFRGGGASMYPPFFIYTLSKIKQMFIHVKLDSRKNNNLVMLR